MKKKLLIYQIIFSFLILSFSSCINQDYDFDDGKLDKTVTIGSSVNLPVGDIEKIFIFKELEKVYDQLKVGDDGVLYIEYEGELDIEELQDFDVPEIQPVETPPLAFNVPNGEIPLNDPLFPVPDTLPLVSGKIENVIPEPGMDDDDFTLDPKEIGFGNLTLQLGFKLSGITLDPDNSNAKIRVVLTIPGNYKLKDGRTSIEKAFSIGDIENNNGEISFGEIEVESYTFGENEDLTYSVVLEKEDATRLTVAQPKFIFIIRAKDPTPDISYLKCFLSGSKESHGEIDQFDDLRDAFSDTDILEFRNPSLELDLTANLGARFSVGIDMSKDDKNVSLTNPWTFGKSTTDTAYLLTPINMPGFNEIISTPFPQKLAYTVKLEFNDSEEAKLPSQLDLSAGYKFRVPFDFTRIDLSLQDTITDLFSEDIYEQVFSHTKKDVSIEADLVDVSIGGGGIKLDISTVILDSKFKEIIQMEHVLKDDKTVSIAIEGADLEKMKNARHLAFVFRLWGTGAITETDYIQIKGLRLVSSSGIHYEF